MILRLGTADLTIDNTGRLTAVVLSDGTSWPVDSQPMLVLNTTAGTRYPTAIRRVGNRLLVTFAGGSGAIFMMTEGTGFLLLTLKSLNVAEDVRSVALFHLCIPSGAVVRGQIAACSHDGWTAAVLCGNPQTQVGVAIGTLRAGVYAAHGLVGAKFGVVFSPDNVFLDTVAVFEKAVGLPSNKQTPTAKRSYCSVSLMHESQTDEVIALAQRGGFDAILIRQDSWCQNTGHFAVNTNHFHDGLPSLSGCVHQLQAAGFRVGLHFLAASIGATDPYRVPVPDPRVLPTPSYYGYRMFDIDSTLLDEVTTNFAAVANACNVDMIYFDGSEYLQGDQWFYCAKLHKAYYEKLHNKNTLMQASSYGQYSWHLMSRHASADGHDDLKQYLDDRSPSFPAYAANFMPLDIGWYNVFDPHTTLDAYEYILGATIGWDASFSLVFSITTAHAHPLMGEILDLVKRYETLRLSGRVDAAMKGRLQYDSDLGRREYRLVSSAGVDSFVRMIDGEQYPAETYVIAAAPP
jgi:hypothetical protein